MSPLDRIAAELAKPVVARVITRYADGSTKHHDTRSIGAAANYAIGERRKIGRKLINRETGATVEVVAVDIAQI